MNIGGRIRTLRGAKGYTLAKMAEKTGMKREYLCRLETGKLPNPTCNTLKRIADALEIPLSEFFETIK